MPVAVLRLLFNRRSGTVTLISATAAGLNPENRPCRPRAAAMCQGSVASAATAIVADAENSARRNIVRRPYRSESTPQTGPATNRPMPCATAATPIHHSAFASLVAPSSFM